MTISGTFRCPRPLNRGVRLIKVSFEVNKGNKFGDFGYCPLNKERPLNKGFTVSRTSDLKMPVNETIWLELHYPRSRPCLFSFVYRPPSADASFCERMDLMLTKVDCRKISYLYWNTFGPCFG